MKLSLYDTLQRAKRPFEPVDPRRVTLYVCGPTVYSYAHVGNGRAAVVFDLLYRVLRHIYGPRQVVYARNITDVDDKINQAAAAAGLPISAITDRFTAIYHQDMDALGVLRPDLEPRATDHIAQILGVIGRLTEAGVAYAADGHVLFDTTRYADYGKLSGRTLDDMIAGARVEVAPYKRNPADFVLWKPSKPGEPSWDSPWGPGRPGWHIECSAMVEAALGLPIDIHGGGHDLIFPHHENEIAQSVAGGPAGHASAPSDYARYWVHNGFLTLEADKMSKSLGNVLLVHELIEQAPGEAVRWALLSAHYRAPLDWTGDLLARSRAALDTFYQSLGDAKRLGVGDMAPRPGDEIEPFLAALGDDLNTPAAIAELYRLNKDLREALRDLEQGRGSVEAAGQRRQTLLRAANLLGFLEADPEAWFEGGADAGLKAQVEALLEQRVEARRSKDWPTADRIRDELTALNVVVMDGPQGATWRLRDSEPT